MRTFRLSVLALLTIGASLAMTQFAHAEEFRMATLAPRGSAWAKVLERGAKLVAKKTEGRITFKWFFAGQQGDERDVVRKMKLGRLDGAAVTAVGLGLIKGDVRVLELPFLFSTDKELDYVRDKMSPVFEKQFDEAGYVLLSWGDVGWVHLMTANRVKNHADLRKVKMWAWTDDPIVRALFRRLEINGVPLGVPDVLTSLQTGLIDGCYGSPLAAVALQWYTKVKYATAMPMSYAIGALVVSKKKWAKISAADRKFITDTGNVMSKKLMVLVRRENAGAQKAMERNGVKFVELPKEFTDKWRAEGRQVWDDLAGKIYPKALLKEVQKHLAEVR